ncbi:hypothetical protein TNCV_3670201 [Trichonephila clavipes]|nr:hypothetical protein TNCV_3670201 [Trichonephila clavipes]
MFAHRKAIMKDFRTQESRTTQCEQSFIYISHPQHPPGIRTALSVSLKEEERKFQAAVDGGRASGLAAAVSLFQAPGALKTRRVDWWMNFKSLDIQSPVIMVMFREGGGQLRGRPRHLSTFLHYEVHWQ